MADKTVLRGATLGVTIETEAHVDFMHRHHAIHRLDRTVAFLAGDACPDMWFVHEFYEIGQRVNAIPPNFEGRLMVIGPRLSDRLDSAEQATAMTTDAACYRRYSGGGRSASIFMAILAGNLVDAGVHSMAERDGLLDVRTRRPGTLRKRHRRRTAEKQEQGHRDQDAVHGSHSSHHR